MLRFTNAFDEGQDLTYDSWTLFVPTDDAFQQLSSYKQRQLAKNRDVAREYVRFTIHLVYYNVNIAVSSKSVLY